MPEKMTVERARKARREGKAPSTQAGEFVREEVHHVREGKHGARSPEQAVAIGLSKARRAGVEVPPPEPGTTSEETRTQAKRDLAKGKQGEKAPAPKRSRAVRDALRREPSTTASPKKLAGRARKAAAKRSPADRSAAAKKAAKTKGATGRETAARKGAKTRTRTR